MSTIQTVTEPHPVFPQVTMEYVPAAEIVERFTPRILPEGWSGPHYGMAVDGVYFTFTRPYSRRFKVLMSAARELDGKVWLHVSLSKWKPNGQVQEEPTWTDIRTIKDLFIGRDRKAIIVLPPDSEYVNMGEVHHLWCCLDEDPLPDFTHGTGSI